MKDEALLKASGGLTGGIGGKNDTCGSLIGACMMLGAICGRGRNDEGMEKIGASIMQSADIYNWFKEKYGSTRCRDILTHFGGGIFYDLHNPDEAEQARKAMKKCDFLVKEVAAKAMEMIYNGPPPPPRPPQ